MDYRVNRSMYENMNSVLGSASYQQQSLYDRVVKYSKARNEPSGEYK